jgi:RNA polymerase sigma-70 factor (ECF subfamily)
MPASARQLDVVTTAVAQLRPELRQVLMETYFRGHTVTETARTLGLPVALVKTRVYDAMRQLRLALAVEGHRLAA